MILIEFLFAPTVPSAPSPKKTARMVSAGFDVEGGIESKRRVSDVVHDSNSEVIPGIGLREFFENGFDHCRRELLRRQTVPARDDSGRRMYLKQSLLLRLGKGNDDVEVQRVADCARLLGPVENGKASGRNRQRGDKIRDRERTVQPHSKHTDPFALRTHELDSLARCFHTRPHHYDDALGGRITEIVEQPIRPPVRAANIAMTSCTTPGTAE